MNTYMAGFKLLSKYFASFFDESSLIIGRVDLSIWDFVSAHGLGGRLLLPIDRKLNPHSCVSQWLGRLTILKNL